MRTMHKNMLKTSIVIGISRLSGFLRELVFSAFLGTSYMMDAFVVAFMVPNFFRRIMGEKAAESVFIPVYVRMKEMGREKGDEYVSKIFTVVGLSLLAGVLIFYPIAPFFIKLVAPGFDSSTFSAALRLTFLILPYMFFIGIYSFLGALLESHRKFTLYNVSPLVFNITLMLFIVLLYNRMPLMSMAAGVMIGVLLQTGILFIQLKKLNVNFRLLLDTKDSAVRQSGKMLIPIVAGSGIEKISIYVDRIMASLLPAGSISALYYSFRLMDLPFAVFSIAISKVIHPRISSTEVNSNPAFFMHYMKRGVLLNTVILIPLSAVMMLFSRQIVALVFMRGAFDALSVSITTGPLIYYTVGLLPMGFVALFSRAFYALLDTWTPLKAAFIASLINVAASVSLMPLMGVSGLALGTSISVWFNALYLAVILYFRIRRISEN